MTYKDRMSQLKLALGLSLALCSACDGDGARTAPPLTPLDDQGLTGGQAPSDAESLDQGAFEDMGASLDLSLDMSPAEDMEAPQSFPNVSEGHPLNPEVGLYPYPSDYFLHEDSESPTGLRLVIPSELASSQLPATVFEGQDGFSRMPMILSDWPGGVDQASLPSEQNHGESLLDSSTTLLIEHGSLTRVPHLAEIDRTAEEPELGPLIIRPVTLLKPNMSYSVIIKRGLRDQSGALHERGAAFEALARGVPSGDEALDRALPAFERTRAVIEGSGLNLDDVLLAWSFHTRSAASVTEPLLSLQDLAMEWPLGEFIVTVDELSGENRQLQGELEAPLYNGPRGIEYDESGAPRLFGTQRFPFSMTIPLSVTEQGGPRPVLLYGHGFLGSHRQATRLTFNELCRRGAISAIGLNFGMYSELSPLLFRGINGEVETFAQLRGGVLQTMVNYSVTARYIQEGLLAERFPELDPNDVQYMGISNGGTFGALFAATSHVVSKATLVVGGGGLSHFLQRASQWNELGFLAKRNFPDPRELQLYLALLQSQLDPIDPINFVDHLVSPRFEGRGPLRASLHMAVNDSQVNNLVTEWVARTAGVPLLTPSPKEIWGLETVEAPLSPELASALPSALTVYDEMVAPYPGGNIAPLEDNGTHGTVRALDVYQRQLIDFITKGELNQLCEGACDPE